MVVLESMPRRMSGFEVVKILCSHGFQTYHYRGGHHVLIRGHTIVHVPHHCLLKPGTCRRIFRKAGLESEYLKLIKGS